MQQQNTIRSERRSTKPNALSKRHGRSSSGDANTTRSSVNAARSYRQTITRDDDDGRQANRRSKKDNRGESGQRSRRSGAPLAKRPAAVGSRKGGGASKNRAPQGSTRRAKQVSGSSKGRTVPNSGGKGNSAKRARSRR